MGVEALQMEMSKAFWDEVVQDPRLHTYLDNLDVPQEDHVDLFEICDSDSSGLLTIDELVMGIKRLRGEPRRSDLVFVMLRVRELIGEVHTLRLHTEEIKSGQSTLRSASSSELATTIDRVLANVPPKFSISPGFVPLGEPTSVKATIVR